MKEKYAIYRGRTGFYALDYVDTMEQLQDFICRYGVNKEDLPIVVNRAGGRTSFSPLEEDFVALIEVEEGEDPMKVYERAEEETICYSSVILRREEILNRMDEVEDALDRADDMAAKSEKRLTHKEVFQGFREKKS